MRSGFKRYKRLLESIDILVIDLERQKYKPKTIAEICTNLAGHSFLFSENDINKELNGLYNLRVKLRGNLDDYIEYAIFKTDLADLENPENALPQYFNTLALIEKVPSNMRNFDYYDFALSIYLEIFRLCDDKPSNSNPGLLITKAFDYANQALLLNDNPNVHTKHNIADIYITYSQFDDRMDKVSKTQLLRKGIQFLREVMDCDLKMDSGAFYSYGHANYLLSREVSEPIEKQLLLLIAVQNLEYSCAINNNPESRDLLKEIEKGK